MIYRALGAAALAALAALGAAPLLAAVLDAEASSGAPDDKKARGRTRGFALANIALSTAQPDKMAEWYRDVLGFEIKERAPGVEGVTTFLIERDGVSIDLIRVPNQLPHEKPLPPPDFLRVQGLRNLVFWVDDQAAANTHLKARGVGLLWESREVPGIGTAITAFRDPDGNLVALWERRPGARQGSRTQPPSDDKEARDAALAGTREFFAALEAGDIPRFLKVWAEDGVQEMPYAPPGFPKRLEGRAAVEKQYGPLPAAYDGMKFPITRLTGTDDPNTVIAEYRGSIGLKTGGRYDNRYVGVFTFDASGKLKHYAEYFDPFTLLSGFPGAAEMGPDGPRRVVQDFARLADARDWKGLRALFADEVDFDYTSVAGGKPGRVKADDIVAGWTQGLGRYKHTKHNFSDPEVKVEGEAATATFTGQATHVRDDSGKDVRWSCGGDYAYKMTRTPQGWRVTAMKFDMKWEQGER